MEVVDRKPVPIYEVECVECKSKIRYRRSEIVGCYITCPVCGVALWADHIFPVDMEEDE